MFFTKILLSFANETASHMDYSKQAVSIASYMRSHIAGKRGFWEIAERDYHEFERNYKIAINLYQSAEVEDSEMVLLEKLYMELIQADWL